MVKDPNQLTHRVRSVAKEFLSSWSSGPSTVAHGGGLVCQPGRSLIPVLPSFRRLHYTGVVDHWRLIQPPLGLPWKSGGGTEIQGWFPWQQSFPFRHFPKSPHECKPSCGVKRLVNDKIRIGSWWQEGTSRTQDQRSDIVTKDAPMALLLGNAKNLGSSEPGTLDKSQIYMYDEF